MSIILSDRLKNEMLDVTQMNQKKIILHFIIPAKAGIQLSNIFMDSRLRGNDRSLFFC